MPSPAQVDLTLDVNSFDLSGSRSNHYVGFVMSKHLMTRCHVIHLRQKIKQVVLYRVLTNSRRII